MRKKKELPKVEPVHLKPLWGMKPGVWLTILYALILVLFIFLAGILPDLAHGFERVYFTSDSNRVAVYIDSKYAGGTPFSTKVASGSHTVVWSVNGVEIDRSELEVGHPVFFNWLFTRTRKVCSSAVLNTQACQALTAEFFSDLARYSAISSYDSVFRYPGLYTDYVKTVLPSGLLSADVLRLSALFATTDEMISDAENAFSLAGVSFDFSTLKEVPVNTASGVIRNETSLSAGSAEIAGWNINSSFCISQTPVSESLWQKFVSENPQWAKSSVTDSYYMADVGSSASKAVRNVSWKAALAFCNWLSELTGKNVRLPSEAEWEAAGLSDAGLWEMTGTYYVPRTTGDNSAIQKLLASYGIDCEITVRRSSKTRGAAPQNLCSDYMGFRIVWD